MWRPLMLAAAVAVAAADARAGLPAAYAPIVVEAQGRPARLEFDLTPALERAKREGKRLYVYLGARDCAFCRKYEAFLAANAAELVPHFAADYLVVDLRSELAAGADRVHLRVGERSLNYTEFQRAIGDARERRLMYPTVWLLGADGKPLMQMPGGTGTFETVPEQLEILRLEQ
ncbi:thioredoxin family protein [Azohydromonas sediminis]|uniref:thioredoxin family protein n=1 Tax=Azohydromonas sediminis TaxID=2259674 RepID=UPI001F3BDD9C|nr:thioredoxin family protein [Azohydromonas sediminis]